MVAGANTTSLPPGDKFESLFTAKYKTGNEYEFEESDVGNVQRLINVLRKQIQESEIEDDWKERLLQRLEMLQRELHRKMSNLDKFWGFIIEAGMVLGQFGKDTQPFIKSVKELMQVVRKSSAKRARLPKGSDPPQIEFKGDK